MDSPLVPIVERRLGELLRNGVVESVYVVDLLACGHEIWFSAMGDRPYSMAVRRRCAACGGTTMGNKSHLPEYRLH